MRLVPLLLALAAACNSDKDPVHSADTTPVDIDGDGFNANEDCDDEDGV